MHFRSSSMQPLLAACAVVSAAASDAAAAAPVLESLFAPFGAASPATPPPLLPQSPSPPLPPLPPPPSLTPSPRLPQSSMSPAATPQTLFNAVHPWIFALSAAVCLGIIGAISCVFCFARRALRASSGQGKLPAPASKEQLLEAENNDPPAVIIEDGIEELRKRLPDCSDSELKRLLAAADGDVERLKTLLDTTSHNVHDEVTRTLRAPEKSARSSMQFNNPRPPPQPLPPPPPRPSWSISSYESPTKAML